ncbi:MAG: CBS domain-containing protein [Nitrospiraceae bacterium]
MNKGMALMGGTGVGAGLMYLFDPDRGKRRRAMVWDQAVSSARQTGEAAETTARDARNRVVGLFSRMKSVITKTKPVGDDVLVERVRSKLGMLVRHPRAIDVTARNGCVTLSGPVLADEVDYLLGMVSRVTGVTRVENRLDVHQDADGVSGLQGSARRPPVFTRFEFMQVHWSPSARLVAGAVGSVMTFYGARQRNALGAGIAAVGLALLTRGMTNREVTRLFDIDWQGTNERRGQTSRRSRLSGRRWRDAGSGRQLREVMTRQVEVIHPDASLEEAAEKMKTLDVGVLPVCDGDRLLGMLTDRDIIVRGIGEKRDLKTVSIRDAMTPDIRYAFEDDSVEEAAMLMVENRIRRLVVLNREKRLVGIVSLGDLAVHTQDTQLSGEVLEYVSEPAEPKR